MNTVKSVKEVSVLNEKTVAIWKVGFASLAPVNVFLAHLEFVKNVKKIIALFPIPAVLVLKTAK